jgi:hypothetical protein
MQLDESEVELDSLGILFVQLIDADSSQDEAENSQVEAVEVTIISSDSEPLPREKTRWVIRKVRFSHPLAHLDPNFILKKQQHESRRQTRSTGSEDLVTGLSPTPTARKRRNEVPHSPTLSLPRAGLIRQPLNPSDSNYQGTPPSSGDSTGTQLPAFVVNPG